MKSKKEIMSKLKQIEQALRFEREVMKNKRPPHRWLEWKKCLNWVLEKDNSL